MFHGLEVLGGSGVVRINLQRATEPALGFIELLQTELTYAQGEDHFHVLLQIQHRLLIKLGGLRKILRAEVGRGEQLQPVRMARLNFQNALHVRLKHIVIARE